jgi:predicted SAM-dependent methyltransferase
MIDLPPIEPSAASFDADYYGAATLIARKLGFKVTPYSKTEWLHGWACDRILDASHISPNSLPSRTILSSKKEITDFFISEGFKKTFTVGLPFLYAETPPVSQIPSSLLVMPPHQTTHSKGFSNHEIKNFLISNKRIIDKFSTVAICVSGSCAKDQGYINFIKSFGYEVLVGAWIFDRNALVRMKIILKSFSTILTKSIGSHIPYAAHCGAKIIISKPILNYDWQEISKTDPQLMRFPYLVDVLKKERINNPPEKLFPIIFQEDQCLDELKKWANNELGASFMREPAEIADLLGWFEGTRGVVKEALQEDHFVAKLLPATWNFPQKSSSAPQSPGIKQGLKPRLNLGCGSQVHPEWTNVDIMPRHPGVINHDLNKQMPFEDESFEAVYHSHVLEHLTKEQGKAFLAECFRVLKHGGILRVVVPDLERIARLYLENLDKAEEGDERASARHEWMLLELLDQMVRETSGGEMGRYFQLNPMPAEDFVIERFGHQVLEVIKPMRANPAVKNQTVPPLLKQIDAMEAARFRQSGEIHKWMYDRRSLGRLMADSGFSQISVRRADESVIPDFGKYHFDRMPDGSTRKPDSLFMEAVKP